MTLRHVDMINRKVYKTIFIVLYNRQLDKTHTVRTISKSNQNIVKTEAKSVPLTHIHDHHGLVQALKKTSDGAKLALLVQNFIGPSGAASTKYINI